MKAHKAYAVVNEYGDIVSQSGVHLWVFKDFATATQSREWLMKNTEREYTVEPISIENFYGVWGEEETTNE